MALHPQLDDLIQRVVPRVKDFQAKGMLAPHAATLDKAGQLLGQALTTDGTAQLSVSDAIAHFEGKFKEAALSGDIRASGIFYHSRGMDTNSGRVALPPANSTEECHVLVGLLEHAVGDSVYLVIPYTSTEGGIEYSPGKLIEKPSAVFVVDTQQTSKPWWKLW